LPRIFIVYTNRTVHTLKIRDKVFDDYEKVLADYDKGRMDVEMAMGHSLQHIGKLYQGQATERTNQRKLRDKIEHLEQKVTLLQDKVDRLTARFEKAQPRQK
jgi:hypothetical protein